MLEKDSMMKLKLHKLMKVRLYLFFEKQHNKNSFSSFCSNDKHPDIFFCQDSYIQIIVQLPTSLPAQSHVKLASTRGTLELVIDCGHMPS